MEHHHVPGQPVPVPHCPYQNGHASQMSWLVPKQRKWQEQVTEPAFRGMLTGRRNKVIERVDGVLFSLGGGALLAKSRQNLVCFFLVNFSQAFARQIGLAGCLVPAEQALI